MLELPLLRSALIGRRSRTVSRRARAGVSAAPFDSLNLGARWGDAAATVEENRRRLLRAVGVAGPLYVARQVHGAAVARVRAGDDPAAIARIEADALITDDPGVALGVFVADCIPALIVDPRTGAVAAAHAGWRGTVAGVLPAAVRALVRRFGARPGDLRVALGPAIGPCCFEVGAEVVAAFAAALGGGRRRRRGASVAARRARQVARRSEGREPAAAGARRRRARRDRRAAPTAPTATARASSRTAAMATAPAS